MSEAAAALEAEMLALTEQTLRPWARKFESLGVSVGSPTLRKGGPAEHYESEVEVYFKDASGIFDLLTFFVYRDGRPAASRGDVEAWLAQDLDGILARRLKKTKGEGHS